MSDSKIKIIDRRMFTPDGELREPYRQAQDAAPTKRPRSPAPGATGAASAPTQAPAPASQQVRSDRPRSERARSEQGGRPAPILPREPDRAPAGVATTHRIEDRAKAQDAEGARFTDLVAFLAQTAAAYLQQARSSALGSGTASSGELLQMARLHLDLLAVVERKTAGNLTLEERNMLQDVQRQLRLALG